MTEERRAPGSMLSDEPLGADYISPGYLAQRSHVRTRMRTASDAVSTHERMLAKTKDAHSFDASAGAASPSKWQYCREPLMLFTMFGTPLAGLSDLLWPLNVSVVIRVYGATSSPTYADSPSRSVA